MNIKKNRVGNLVLQGDVGQARSVRISAGVGAFGAVMPKAAKRVLHACVQEVAYLYAAYARDRAIGSAEAATFEDAVLQQRLIDEIARQSATFLGKASA